MGIRNNVNSLHNSTSLTNSLTTTKLDATRGKRTLLSIAMLGALSLLVGCNQAPKAADSTNSSETANQGASTPASALEAPASASVAASTKPVTIYSSRKEQLIQPLLDQFTKETGTPVELVTDDGGPLIARLKAEGKNTQADVFLTVDAGNLWEAGQQGLLQPLQSTVVNSNVPQKYRANDDLWTGLSLRARTIFYDPAKVAPTDLSTYADLAEPKWKGKLCLRTSKKVYNQSLVASMIEHYGEEKTEAIVKGWVANLAAPVFSDDTKLLEAIAAGQCQVGIANSYYYGRLVEKNPNFPVKIFWPNQGKTGDDALGVHVNVSGAGIIKNSDNVVGARQLIEWLSSDTAQSKYASSDKEYPVKAGIDESEMLRSWGSFKQDDINVSMFGQRQGEAVKLMDRAGYQ